MKTRSQVLALACAAAFALCCCQQNAYLLQNAPGVPPAGTAAQHLPAASTGQPAFLPFSHSFAEECQFQAEQFSSRFFGNMSLPHQTMVQY